jgi:hypothetical protein
VHEESRTTDEPEYEHVGGGKSESVQKLRGHRGRDYQELMERTIPWMKNFRRPTNNRIVGTEVKMTAVMIHGMFPPP